MAARRSVRYYKERMPGKGVVLNSVDRGQDPPLTKQDSRLLVMGLVAVFAVALLVAMIWSAIT